MFKKANKIEEETKDSNEVTFREIISSDIFKSLIKRRLKRAARYALASFASLNLTLAYYDTKNILELCKDIEERNANHEEA